MDIITNIQTISTTISNLIDFIQTNEKIKPDFEEYLKTINATNVTGTRLQAACIPYITERIIFQENKSVTEIYLDENQDISSLEKDIVLGLKDSISAIFEIKKVLRNGFVMYNLINEKTYTIMPLVKMTNLRSVLPDQYALVRIFKFQNEYYMLEISDLIPSYQRDEVLNFAVAKIIEKPEDLYFDNEDKLNEVKNYVENSISSFKKLFGSDEIITTNRKIDDLVNIFNDYMETKNLPQKSEISNLIENKETYEYFKVEEFSNSYDTFLKSSLEGFSSHIEKYDVGYICDKELGIYIIPFWATLNQIFTSDNYKDIKNYQDCVKDFIKNDKIPPSFIEKLAQKCPSKRDFETRLSEIMGEELSIQDAIKQYKGEYLKKTIYSSASVLYCSKTFAELISKQENELEKV